MVRARQETTATRSTAARASRRGGARRRAKGPPPSVPVPFDPDLAATAGLPVALDVARVRAGPALEVTSLELVSVAHPSIVPRDPDLVRRCRRRRRLRGRRRRRRWRLDDDLGGWRRRRSDLRRWGRWGYDHRRRRRGRRRRNRDRRRGFRGWRRRGRGRSRGRFHGATDRRRDGDQDQRGETRVPTTHAGPSLSGSPQGLPDPAATFCPTLLHFVRLDRVLHQVRHEDTASLGVVPDVGRRLLVAEHRVEGASELALVDR